MLQRPQFRRLERFAPAAELGLEPKATRGPTVFSTDDSGEIKWQRIPRSSSVTPILFRTIQRISRVKRPAVVRVRRKEKRSLQQAP